MGNSITNNPAGPLRIKAIYCSVLTREVAYCVVRSRNIIEPHRLPSGLHDLGAERMSARLQETIDQLDDGKAAAIVLIYGLCNNGVVGLRPRHAPLVIARAHDCITWLLGSKERYQEIFGAEPGTYYYSPGWVESPPEKDLGAQGNALSDMGIPKLDYNKLVEQYGEENAKYLKETLYPGTTNYRRYLWIESEVGEFPEYRENIRARAERDHKRFETAQGSVSLIQRAFDGDWDNGDFTVCRPGQRLVARVATSIIGVESSD